jgi:hypothetical protein
VARPLIRVRHILNELAFMCARINAITADSFNPNCVLIASNGVRSSHAISTMREMSDSGSKSGTLASVMLDFNECDLAANPAHRRLCPQFVAAEVTITLIKAE